MIDQSHLSKVTSYLVSTGHVNIDYVTNMYETGGNGLPPTTYIEYVDMDGEIRSSATDIDLSELDTLIINMPTVELPPEDIDLEMEEW